MQVIRVACILSIIFLRLSSAVLFKKLLAEPNLPTADLAKPGPSKMVCSAICVTMDVPDCTQFRYDNGTCHIYSTNSSVDIQTASDPQTAIVTHSLLDHCPAGWFLSLDLISCYKLVIEKLDWHQSQSNCRNLYPTADLATIRSAAENRRLSFAAERQDTTRFGLFWIKLNDLKELGKFVWDEGYYLGEFEAWFPGYDDPEDPQDMPMVQAGYNCVLLSVFDPPDGIYFATWSNGWCPMKTTSICEFF